MTAAAIAASTSSRGTAGKRIVKKASGKAKTEAKAKLKEIIRDHDDGLASGPADYTIADAVTSWLTYGLHGRDPNTVANYRTLCDKHIIPGLGARKLRELSAEDVDRWLIGKAKTLSARTVRLLHSCLNRAVKFAQARDKVKRNVVGLCEVPEGKEGRPSKALNPDQAEAILKAAGNTRMYAYVVLSLLIGARTEELRALAWSEVDLEGDFDNGTPPWIAVWWKENDLVFASLVGTPLDSHNVRRAFRKIVKDAGLPAKD